MLTTKTAIWFDLVLWCAMLCLGIANGCQSPIRPNNVAEQFLRDYAVNLNGGFSKAAAAVEEGIIKTDAELLDALKHETEFARKEAAKSIDHYLEANLSNGELSSKDVTVLRDLGKQFQGVYRGR